MGLSAALSIATSSLANVTGQLSLVSHNVANADTPGYVAEIATQQSATVDGIGLGVVSGPATRYIDAALQAQAFQQNSTVAGLQTTQTALQAIDAVQGTPGAGGDIASQLGDLQDQFSTLLNDPDNQTQQAVCTTSVTDYTALQPAFQPDSETVTGQGDIYSSYSGNGRRVITVTVVDALPANTATPMTVLGFRQFLVQPNPDGTFFDPSDPNGRFVATYIGSPMPVRQGYVDDRFGQSCPAPVSSGPGKVVLHR